MNKLFFSVALLFSAIITQAQKDFQGIAVYESKTSTSDFKKRLAGYNIFITNASPELVKTEQIYGFYRLRWQIELLFKIWKSVFELDQVGKMSIARFECYLYGKLIAILISGHMQSLFKAFMAGKAEFELSEWKAYKLIKKS